MSTPPRYVQILLPIALPGTFTYLVPDRFATPLKAGQRVIVPFGARKSHVGIVWENECDEMPPHLNGQHPGSSSLQLREIAGVIDEEPIIKALQFTFWNWIAEYYMCHTGEVMKAALPSAFRKGSLTGSQPKDQPPADITTPELSPLTPEQALTLETFRRQASSFAVQLLYGVTSSGKTEFYIHLIHEQLNQNRQVLYLLPEIALTTQIIKRLKKVFGTRMVVYHSRFTEKERINTWTRVAQSSEEGLLILGVRSSVFLPFGKLSLIIVDEEHENTYKQFDPAPRYHARDSAIILGQLYQARVLLGTATPSAESWHHAMQGKYGLLRLNKRFGGIHLPRVILSDVREAKKKKVIHGHFTPLMLEAIDQALINKEQIILFQNRRGYSPFIQCLNCAHIPKCTACDVSLTYHRQYNKLVCHYCGQTTAVPPACPACGSTGLIAKGLGTQKIEDEIGIIFPNAKIQRMDVDSTRSKKSYENILAAFEKGEIDILIGTQMISKGLDFNNVSLVGILDADQLLNYPDFRSFERSFQLMMQVSGRAGRRDQQGTVIIQCSDPGHPVIQYVLNGHDEQYYLHEIADRKLFKYPPFSRLIQIHLKHKDPDTVQAAALALANELKRLLPPQRVVGPQSPLISRVQNLHLKVILIKLQKDATMREKKKRIFDLIENYRKKKNFAGIIIQPDVDPA